ncbi:MAG TPA: SIS domain-containing protein [Egibacteraceae bacterium]|nr:SIS domain-containing protein [Egibacteraceae bacterium]
MSQLDAEIREQPEALQRLLDAELGNVDRLGKLMRRDEITSVVMVARGSSDNAARYAQYLFGAHHGLSVALAAPSLITLYERAPRMDGALVIGVSQSGRSPDVVGVVQAARDQGRPTLAVTNEPDSPLAHAAADVLGLHAGEERSVAATKTYTCSLAALALVSAALEEPNARRERLDALRAAPEAVGAAVASSAERAGQFDRYRYMGNCAVVGRGFNYSTAFEIALKMKELCGVIAEPYSPPDLIHGPIAAISEGFPVILVAPDEPSIASIRELLAPLEKHRAELVVISGAQDLLTRARVAFPLTVQPEPWLTPLVAVVPGQIMSARLVAEQGADPDRPRGLTKVTETR